MLVVFGFGLRFCGLRVSEFRVLGLRAAPHGCHTHVDVMAARYGSFPE